MAMAATPDDYPIQLYVRRPERPSRGLALAGVLFLKLVLLIPHLLVLFVLNIAQVFIVYFCYLAVLFTGRFPDGLYGYVTGFLQWYVRAMGWLYGLTDVYPPFSLGVTPPPAQAAQPVIPSGPPPIPPPPPSA